MASFEPQDFDLGEPPPRPTTPPVRWGFVLVLLILLLLATLVYGIPYMADRSGYAWESGRSRAASEALAKLDKEGIVGRASELFRMATVAVAPAVVHVRTQRVLQDEGRPGIPLAGGADLPGPRFENTGLGSGVIIDKDRGFIVTNNHVIKDADQIIVRLTGGADLPARLVGADPKSDLAVLQVNASLRVAAEWGDSDKLDMGDWVLAIGSPFALDQTVTAGIISSTERNDLRINEYEAFLQTDAAINSGNSGGPLVDLSGKVIGINTAMLTETGGYQGIGLAIPSSMARRVVEGLIEEGRVVRGYLGVQTEPLTPRWPRSWGRPRRGGRSSSGSWPDSPAAKAGLRVGDVIVKVGGKAVTDPLSLRNRTVGLAVGTEAPVTFYREGESQTVKVTITERPGRARPEPARVPRPRAEPRRDGPAARHARHRSGRPRQPRLQGRPPPRHPDPRRRPDPGPHQGRIRQGRRAVRGEGQTPLARPGRQGPGRRRRPRRRPMTPCGRPSPALASTASPPGLGPTRRQNRAAPSMRRGGVLDSLQPEGTRLDLDTWFSRQSARQEDGRGR